MVMSFNRAFWNERHGKWDTSRRNVIIKYLTTWFVPDLLASLPYGVLLLPGVLPSESSSRDILSLLRLLKTLRLSRNASSI